MAVLLPTLDCLNANEALELFAGTESQFPAVLQSVSAPLPVQFADIDGNAAAMQIAAVIVISFCVFICIIPIEP